MVNVRLVTLINAQYSVPSAAYVEDVLARVDRIIFNVARSLNLSFRTLSIEPLAIIEIPTGPTNISPALVL